MRTESAQTAILDNTLKRFLCGKKKQGMSRKEKVEEEVLGFVFNKRASVTFVSP